MKWSQNDPEWHLPFLLQSLTTAVTMSTIMIASRSTTTTDPTPAATPTATPAVIDAYYVTMNRKGWYLNLVQWSKPALWGIWGVVCGGQLGVAREYRNTLCYTQLIPVFYRKWGSVLLSFLLMFCCHQDESEKECDRNQLLINVVWTVLALVVDLQWCCTLSTWS